MSELDQCQSCGDYRRDHDAHGCKLCRGGQFPWERMFPCHEFRLAKTMFAVTEALRTDDEAAP